MGSVKDHTLEFQGIKLFSNQHTKGISSRSEYNNSRIKPLLQLECLQNIILPVKHGAGV